MEAQHKVEPGKFSMAAMSDMAFLLIIFFMVCAKFVEKSDIPVALPRSATGAEAQDAPINVTINPKGTVFVDGYVILNDELLGEFKGRIRMAETPDAKTVIVRADKSLNYEKIRPVVDAVDRAGGMLELSVLGER